MSDKMTEVSPGEFIYIPPAAREAFRRPAFAYTALCPVPELRPKFEKVKEERRAHHSPSYPPGPSLRGTSSGVTSCGKST